jgi:hypothetical protein
MQVDVLLLRYLECSDRKAVYCQIKALHETIPTGWVTRGQLPDGRKWGVEGLLLGAARLHVWPKPEVTPSHRVYDYCNQVVATLAVLEWEGMGREPKWWKRCLATHRRRTYLSDGSFTEEVRQ